MRNPARLLARLLQAVALACVAASAAPASAQIQQRADADFCWRGRPEPACRAFLVAEGNLYAPFAGSRYTRQGFEGEVTRSLELTWYAAWEVGGMVNLDEDDAVGAVVLVGGDANGARMGLKGRFRRWLGPAAALDLGAGVLRAGRSVPRTDGPGNRHVTAVGLTGDAALGFTEWASLGVRADVLFSRDGQGPATAYYGGVRLGTRPALAATAAPLVLAAVAFLVVGTGSP